MGRIIALFVFSFFTLACGKKVGKTLSKSGIGNTESALYANSTAIAPDISCVSNDDNRKTFTVSVVPWSTQPDGCSTDSTIRPDFCRRAPKREIIFNWPQFESGVNVESQAILPGAVLLARSGYAVWIVYESFSNWQIDYSKGEYLAVMGSPGQEMQFSCSPI